MKVSVFFQTMTVTTVEQVPGYTIMDIWGKLKVTTEV